MRSDRAAAHHGARDARLHELRILRGEVLQVFIRDRADRGARRERARRRARDPYAADVYHFAGADLEGGKRPFVGPAAAVPHAAAVHEASANAAAPATPHAGEADDAVLARRQHDLARHLLELEPALDVQEF